MKLLSALLDVVLLPLDIANEDKGATRQRIEKIEDEVSED